MGLTKFVVNGGARKPTASNTRTRPVVVVTNSQPGTTKSTSAELYRCKRKAEREIGSQQPAWIQTMTTVSQYLLSVAERATRILQRDSQRRTNMQRPVAVVVTNSQPLTTKSTSAELYRCKRKAEREIGSQQSAWIQTMTVSQYLLSVAERATRILQRDSQRRTNMQRPVVVVVTNSQP